MLKFIIILMISFLCINTHVKAIDYAILISGGVATTDNTFSNSEYWYDLFLAYEDLVLNEGYDPANVFVFYGSGTSFNSTLPRYNTSLHGWGNIVNFNNSPYTLSDQFRILGTIITNNDNLHIRWVVGHGGGNNSPEPTTWITGRDPINNDDYWACIENYQILIRETELIRIIDQIPNYKRRKIIWMTCHAGCLTSGAHTLNNDRTTIITASSWDESSYPYWLPNETIHAELNYVVTSALSKVDPLGTAFNGDNNGDNVVNMWELWRIADVSPIMTSNPQLGDNGTLANRIYIDEGLQLNNITLPRSYNLEYRVDNFNTNNTTIQFNSNVTIDIDQGFNATGTLNAPIGVVLTIK